MCTNVTRISRHAVLTAREIQLPEESFIRYSQGILKYLATKIKGETRSSSCHCCAFDFIYRKSPSKYSAALFVRSFS